MRADSAKAPGIAPMVLHFEPEIYLDYLGAMFWQQSWGLEVVDWPATTLADTRSAVAQLIERERREYDRLGALLAKAG